MEPLVTARNLHKSFPIGNGKGKDKKIQVLDGVSLDVQPGEMVSIVGPSGSGKSTLLYCLSGLEPVDAGSVKIAGKRIENARPNAAAKIRREHIGFIFQSYNLVPSLRAGENVALPARLAGHPLTRKQLKDVLGKVSLADRAKDKVSNMSGGEQQRIAIARALASHAEIVFADEPTGALDTKNANEVLRLLRAVTDEAGRSVVMVTHNLEAASIADRVVVLRDRQVVSELSHPTPEQILEKMEASR